MKKYLPIWTTPKAWNYGKSCINRGGIIHQWSKSACISLITVQILKYSQISTKNLFEILFRPRTITGYNTSVVIPILSTILNYSWIITVLWIGQHGYPRISVHWCSWWRNLRWDSMSPARLVVSTRVSPSRLGSLGGRVARTQLPSREYSTRL